MSVPRKETAYPSDMAPNSPTPRPLAVTTLLSVSGFASSRQSHKLKSYAVWAFVSGIFHLAYCFLGHQCSSLDHNSNPACGLWSPGDGTYIFQAFNKWWAWPGHSTPQGLPLLPPLCRGGSAHAPGLVPGLVVSAGLCGGVCAGVLGEAGCRQHHSGGQMEPRREVMISRLSQQS